MLKIKLIGFEACHFIIFYYKHNSLFKASSMYLDLSHGNLKEDSDLLREAKSARKFFRCRIEVFSAAFNTLSTAPYKTLYSMKESLKFLSLRGNKFADLIPDAEGKFNGICFLDLEIRWHPYSDGQLSFAISAFGRLINEARADPSHTTQHKCEELLAQNATDLYDRECFLYFQNNTNTHSITTGLNYSYYIQLLRDRSHHHGKTRKTT